MVIGSPKRFVVNGGGGQVCDRILIGSTSCTDQVVVPCGW